MLASVRPRDIAGKNRRRIAAEELACAEGHADAAGGCAQYHFALTLESMWAGLRKARDARPD